jgi:dimethylargininase
VSRRIALVRRPSGRIADGIVTYGERAPVDPARAAEQHAAYVEAIAAGGWEVVEVPHDDAQPDSAFVEDTVVVCGDLAVLTRPGAAARRAEVDGTEEVVSALGLRLASIEEPGTLDGGDVLRVGTTLYAGRGGRTNAEGIRQLGEHVAPLGGPACLVAASAPRSAELFRDWGFDPVVVDIGEFEKMEGCVTCLSVLM